ncbi:YegS/Rv2252/BmrU family lipid kinase [Halobacillus litoralis]|uniref:YegS/Rv2252/BmrU family lipid kinase n=1 Tax=Halobacillus litoralis TaxID=45668 RepID=UPI001CD3E031|nr:YegS/Rv2252/BmrU family lipid kinase [Halobacillus litoralis]MCA1023927.1 YegS/Rv2252/BmrU family lipid kinase [Halobacillus litoralis]
MPRFETGILLYNGNKEDNEITPALRQVLPEVSKEVKDLHVIQTASLEELRDVCRTHGPETDVFLILGGDGTIHECINSMADLEKRPVIGILPAGTCNDFSRVLDIPQRLDQAAASIMKGEELQVDAGKTEDTYFINFWGIGLVAQTSFNIDENQKNRLGVLSYFISALKTVNRSEPFDFSLTIDGEKLEGEAVMILVMNGQFIGTRKVPMSSLDLQDGKFDVLIVKNSSLAVFREWLAMGRERSVDQKIQDISYRQGRRITIETESKEEVDMDGEIKTETPAQIDVLPGHFTFLGGGPNALHTTSDE